MLSKIDVREIVLGHFDTLRDFGTGRPRVSDYLLFVGVPIAIGALVVLTHFGVTVNAVNGILMAFSIFAGLLFNLLVMVLTFLQSSHGSAGDRLLATRKELLRQISSNLSFAILCAVLVVIAAIIVLSLTDSARIGAVGSGIILAGSVNVALTLLMILKRMYALLMNEFERSKLNRVA